MLIIMVIAVIVIGPRQLPQVARTMGRMFAQLKRATNDLRSAVSKEIAEQEELSDFKQFTSDLESEVYDIRTTAQRTIDREVEKEEAELRRLEGEVTGEGDDAGQEPPGEEADSREATAEYLPTEDYGPRLEGPQEPARSAEDEPERADKPAGGRKESA